MLKYSKFIIQPLKDNKVKLKRSIRYKDIIIPKGFRSNGASIPFIAKLFGIDKFRMDYLPCVIIHDYLCSLQQYKKADEYFKKSMLELHIDKFSMWIMYYSVRIYHILKYGE